MTDGKAKVEEYIKIAIAILDMVTEFPTEELGEKIKKAFDNLQPILGATFGRLNAAMRDDILKRAELVKKIQSEHRLSEAGAIKLVLESYETFRRSLASGLASGRGESE